MSVDLMKNKFNSKEFNADFEKYKDELKKQNEQKDLIKLNSLNTEIRDKKLSEMTLKELLFEWRNSMVGIINDIVHLRFVIETFTKDNRAFFLGITLIIICIFLFLFYELLKPENKNIGVKRNENTFNISLNIPREHKSFFENLVKFFNEKKQKNSN